MGRTAQAFGGERNRHFSGGTGSVPDCGAGSDRENVAVSTAASPVQHGRVFVLSSRLFQMGLAGTGSLYPVSAGNRACAFIPGLGALSGDSFYHDTGIYLSCRDCALRDLPAAAAQDCPAACGTVEGDRISSGGRAAGLPV